METGKQKSTHPELEVTNDVIRKIIKEHYTEADIAFIDKVSRVANDYEYIVIIDADYDSVYGSGVYSIYIGDHSFPDSLPIHCHADMFKNSTKYRLYIHALLKALNILYDKHEVSDQRIQVVATDKYIKPHIDSIIKNDMVWGEKNIDLWDEVIEIKQKTDFNIKANTVSSKMYLAPHIHNELQWGYSNASIEVKEDKVIEKIPHTVQRRIDRRDAWRLKYMDPKD